MTYDYLVVGAGLFGATFAREAANRGYKVKVIEKRSHIAEHIFSILVIKEFGIMCISLLHLIVIQIPLLRILMVKFIIYHLT